MRYGCFTRNSYSKLIIFIASLLISSALAQEWGLEVQDVSHLWDDQRYLSKKWKKDKVKLNPKNLVKVTISGFSSGGALTANLLAMYNDVLDGGAILAGFGPCASYKSDPYCKTGEKKIYDQKGLWQNKVFIYGGKLDDIVKIRSVKHMTRWFMHRGSTVETWYPNFGHVYPNTLPINDQYNPLESCTGVGMINCQESATAKYFGFLYDTEHHFISLPWIKYNGAAPLHLDWERYGNLYAINQNVVSDDNAKLLDYGFLYVPFVCRTNEKPCKFHIFFHGCKQSAILRGTEIIRKSEIIEHAAANDVIVLFPQTNDPDTANNAETAYYPHCWISSLRNDKWHP